MKKFNKYHSNYDSLCLAWVRGEVTVEAHTIKNRMFCTENELFSYGSHFCVARRWVASDTGREWFLLTERRFSPTTTTHQQSAFNIIPTKKLILLPQVDDIGVYGLEESGWEDCNHPELLHKTDEVSLGQVVLRAETDRLFHYLNSTNKKLRPNGSYMKGRFDNAKESIARFGIEVPQTWVNKEEEVQKHCELRTNRNIVLDSIKVAKNRLLGV